MIRHSFPVIDPDNPEPALISKAAELLTVGKVVVCPTETRYGLLVRADNAAALDRLYSLKRRPKEMPTAIFVRSRGEIGRFGRETGISRALAEKFLPGPLTLVLESLIPERPPVVVGGKIGIRCSSCAVIQMLIALVDYTVTATSANLSGSPEPITVTEIAAQFEDKVALYLDAGPLRRPVSTVVDGSGDRPRILREGAISERDIMNYPGAD